MVALVGLVSFFAIFLFSYGVSGDSGDLVPIVITAKEVSGFSVQKAGVSIGVRSPHSTQQYTRWASRGEIELLKMQGFAVEVVPRFSTQLTTVVGTVNASSVWSLQVGATNITGTRETVCIIDTGTNFNHTALLGKNLTCVIDCYNKACVENCSLGDDNGHGTHVAGIVGASVGINGIAPNVSLISLKVLNSAGNAHSSTGSADIAAAIDWCVLNRLAYNISVVSMSLGTDVLFSSACDTSFTTTITPAINNATLFNVTVVAASGNAGNVSAIVGPACITNATAVGATNTGDSGMASYSNYNSLIDVVAPGTITSTWYDGGYREESGTSMATPVVSGALVLVRQFGRLQQGANYTVAQLVSYLQNQGKNITAGGNTFKRVNVLASLLSLDSSVVHVTLVSPANNSVSSSGNQTFSCNGTGFALRNLTFYLWNASGSLNTSSVSVVGSSANLSSVQTNLALGDYMWNCRAFDLNGNSSFAGSGNYSFSVSSIATTLVSPSDASAVGTNQSYSCNATSSTSLTNVTFYLWNASGDSVVVQNKSVSGVSNSSSFQANFSVGGNHSWNCLFANNLSASGFAFANFSIVYDVIAPVLSSVVPANNSFVNTGLFNVTLNENGSCSYSLSNGATNHSMSSSDNRVFNASNTTLVQGQSYTARFYCNDSFSNFNRSVMRLFSVDTTVPNVSLAFPADGASYSGAQTIGFVFNVTDNLNMSSCSLFLSGNNVGNSSSVSLDENETISVSVGEGSYTWNVNCTDNANNIGNSSSRSLTVNAVSVSSSSSGGGGGGSGSGIKPPAVYTPSVSETNRGYTQTLAPLDSVQIVYDAGGERHSIKVDSVNNDSVNLTITSNPIKLVLGIGQSARLNLSSATNYDLYVKLEAILDKKAVLAVQTINEPIGGARDKNESVPVVEDEETSDGTFIELVGGGWWWLFFWVVGVMIIVGVVVYLVSVRKDKDKKIVLSFIKKQK